MSMTPIIFTYQPGRFAPWHAQPFGQAMWAFLSAEDSVAAMLQSVREGRPAIAPILANIEERWAEEIASCEDVGVMVNNMIKQIMEQAGWRHVACGLCPQGRFIKVSGVYRPAAIPEPTQ